MSALRVLVDAGPLVAMVSRRDAHHERAVVELRRQAPPLWTCWPVLTEAAWLLRQNRRGRRALFRAFTSNVIQLLPLPSSALSWIDAFLERYTDLPADFGDAALVYLAETEGIDTVFTFDRDFSIYRVRGKRRLRLLPE